MRVVKIILAVGVIALAVALLAFAGYFLWSALPGSESPPEVLQSALVGEEEPAPTPPAEELPVEDPPAEEPSAEEPPAEAPSVEEQPEEPPAEEEVPDTAALQQQAQAYLETMTLEEKVWQLFIVTPEALTGYPLVTRAGEATQEALEERPVGGLIYFSDNLENREQTKTMLQGVQSYAKTGMFLCVDEEGGLVARVGRNPAMGTTYFEAAAVYGERADMAEVYNVGKTMAQELTELGFNLNFAPVADVVTNPNNTEIGSRAYSSDPQTAGALVAAMVEGLQRNGMISCLKHFPGHGSTEADSHDGTSVSDRTVEEMQQSEWIPFYKGIQKGASFVMLSHLTNIHVSEYPASLSAQMVTYLREGLGFAGIIITDSQQMGAVTEHFTAGEAALKALEAGVDMILMPEDLQEAQEAILVAVEKGELTEERINESVLRILMVKYQYGILSE